MLASPSKQHIAGSKSSWLSSSSRNSVPSEPRESASSSTALSACAFGPPHTILAPRDRKRLSIQGSLCRTSIPLRGLASTSDTTQMFCGAHPLPCWM
eukprot:1483542-Amphidinium_carterae.1